MTKESINGKTFFFDTNIYNHLCDDFDMSSRASIITCIKEKCVVICTIPQILGELAATFKSNPIRGQRLCQLYASFLDDEGVMYQTPELILMELAVHFGGINIKELEEYSNNRGEDFGKALAKLMSGDFDKETESFIENATLMKKQHHKSFKEAKKRGEDLKSKGADVSYDKIWNDEIRSGRVKEGVAGFLQGMIKQGRLPKLDVEKISNSIVSNLDKLPHFKAASRIVPTITYRYFLKDERAKRGDLEDLGILVAVATLDGFVSNDEGALDSARLMYPGKIVLNLNEFLQFMDASLKGN